MLQILIWAVCGVLLGIGYCGMYLEKIAAKEKVKGSTGIAFFILMVVIAGVIVVLSIGQGAIPGLLNK